MSTSYTIDFTDPLRPGFVIAPGGFNGPGGAVAASSLRLYGRGALEWGEAVDEDLLRLVENFASATPPEHAIGGQLWYNVSLYVMVGAAPVVVGSYPPNKFYRYNFGADLSTTTDDAWDDGNHTPSNGFDVEVRADASVSAIPAGTAAGQYVYLTTTGKLYRWDRFGQQSDYSWLERSMTTSASTPTTADHPRQQLRIYNEFSEEWVSPSVANVAVTPSTTPVVGEFWYNETTEILSMWNGTTWVPVLMGNGVPNASDLDMGGFDILNVGGIGSPDYDGANKAYVDAAVDLTSLAATLDSRYVNVTGDTMTGTLTLAADPITNLEAATKQYVDTTVAAGVAGAVASAAVVYTSGSPTYKAGDIFTNGTNIWIAAAAGVGGAPGGNWKQVFPAAYG